MKHTLRRFPAAVPSLYDSQILVPLGFELTVVFQVVPKHSACISGAVGAAKVAILSDHHNMVKFKGADDEGFRRVNGELSIMLKKAVRKMEDNREELASSEHSGW